MYFHFVLLYRAAKKIDNVEMFLFLLNLIRTKDLLIKYLKYVSLSLSFWLPIF
jgi:hypothetical protein